MQRSAIEALRVCRLCATPGLAKFLIGAGFGAGCLQGLQVFFPAIAVEIGLWPDEADAATNFGAAIVGGTVFGGVLHGYIAEKCTRRLGSLARQWPALEARALMLIMATTTTTGAFVAVCLSRFMAGKLHGPTIVGIILAGALLLGSLGLGIRTPLLLVPVEMRPVAVLLGTLAGYAGEFTGPPLVGLLKDTFAPLCKTIQMNGSQVVDPRCGASKADQEGLGTVLALPSLLALTAAFFWLWASFTIERPGCCGGDGPGSRRSRATELTRTTVFEHTDPIAPSPLADDFYQNETGAQGVATHVGLGHGLLGGMAPASPPSDGGGCSEPTGPM